MITKGASELQEVVACRGVSVGGGGWAEVNDQSMTQQ